jgi:hypothetical protein
MAGIFSVEPSDYELKIDAQVEKFVENKQKLTYFLITASAAVIAFVVNFTVTQKANFPSLVIFTSLAGLATIAFSLLNLHFEHSSYRLNIKYRYEKRSWSQLTKPEQDHWGNVNRHATFFLESAFVFLFIETLIAVVFFVAVFLGLPNAKG